MGSRDCPDTEANDDRTVSRVFGVARLQAAHCGLTHDDVQDCAVQFTARVVQKNSRALRSDAWLHRCARNYARDFCRARLCWQNHEAAWPEAARAGSLCLLWDCPDGAPSVEAGLLRKEFCERVTAAVARLEPAPREMLVRHHLHGECIQEIATASGRTPAAVKQALFRARNQLRALLQRQGFDETELCEYLAAIQPFSHPPQTLRPPAVRFDD